MPQDQEGNTMGIVMMEAEDTQTALKWTDVLHKCDFDKKHTLVAATFDEYDALTGNVVDDVAAVAKPDFLATHSYLMDASPLDQLVLFKKMQDD